MKKVFILSLLLFSHCLHAYTKEHAERHAIIAAKCIAGIYCAFHTIQSVHDYQEILEGYQILGDRELAAALRKLAVASGALSFFAFKSAYSDIKN